MRTTARLLALTGAFKDRTTMSVMLMVSSLITLLDTMNGADKEGDGNVFATGWGEPVHPDAASSLMASLIKLHNEP